LDCCYGADQGYSALALVVLRRFKFVEATCETYNCMFINCKLDSTDWEKRGDERLSSHHPRTTAIQCTLHFEVWKGSVV
jgi:hypothetical protein